MEDIKNYENLLKVIIKEKPPETEEEREEAPKKRKPPKVNATGRVLTSKGSIQSVNY